MTMSKNKHRQWQPSQTSAQSPAIDDDATPEIEEITPPPEPDPNALAAGQVYDGVLVPDREINILQLPKGYKLPAIVLEGPYVKSGVDWWIASFVGESCTKLYVDAEMLATGTRVS
jgi:hypothetical protein